MKFYCHDLCQIHILVFLLKNINHYLLNYSYALNKFYANY